MDTEPISEEKVEDIKPSWEDRMDVMEGVAAVGEKFFAKTGNKDELLYKARGEEIRGDTRALILRVPIDGNYVVITRDGPMTIQYDPRKGDEIPPSVLWILQQNGQAYVEAFSEQREKYHLTLPDLIDRTIKGQDLFRHENNIRQHAASGYLEIKGVRKVSFGALKYGGDTGLPPSDPATAAITCGETSYIVSPLRDGSLLKRAMEESLKTVGSPKSIEGPPPPSLQSASNNLTSK